MEEKNITQQESLAIIQQMIDKTKQKLNDNSKFFFLWGFAVFICAITQYVMLKMLLLNTQKVWIAMPIIAIIHIILAIKERKGNTVQTHNDAALQALWTALGIGFIILAYLSFTISFNIFPFYILLYGIGTFVTGKIIQFKPLTFGGIVCFLLSIIITYINGAEQLLILAASVLVSYIIPGILLKLEFSKQQKQA
jgi:hypothetical protein